MRFLFLFTLLALGCVEYNYDFDRFSYVNICLEKTLESENVCSEKEGCFEELDDFCVAKVINISNQICFDLGLSDCLSKDCSGIALDIQYLCADESYSMYGKCLDDSERSFERCHPRSSSNNKCLFELDRDVYRCEREFRDSMSGCDRLSNSWFEACLQD